MNDILTPIITFAQGRSGTTLAMYILSCSKDIYFHKEYPFESRDLLYLLRLAQVCTSANESITNGGDLYRNDLNSIGRYPFSTNCTFLAQAEKSTPLVLKALWAGYSAEARKVSSSRYYAEKMPPIIYPIIKDLIDCKHIFLFRDPRAEMLSIMRFNKQRQVLGFGWQDGETPEQFATRLCVRRSKNMKDLIKIKNNESHFKILYEDLISHFSAALDDLEDYLQIKFDREKLHAGLSSFSHHMTSIDAIKSLNDWKHALPEDVKEIFSTQLKDELASFGYDP